MLPKPEPLKAINSCSRVVFLLFDGILIKEEGCRFGSHLHKWHIYSNQERRNKKAQGKSPEELHNRGELTKVDIKVVGRSDGYHVHYNDWKTVPSETEVFLMRGQITASWENCSWLLP